RRMEAESDPAFEDFGAVVRGTYGRDHAYETGDAEKGLLSCSSAVGFAERVEPVEAIVSGIVEGARAEFARLDAMRAAATRGASASAA
ncbi:MAG: nitronate monooxygenase, partial [Pseudomonadota bacterium]|nr:nitronate monooxygenase [Pseudomonadota bacterium]